MLEQYYVRRNGSGAVDAIFAHPQDGIPEEILPSSHPQVAALLAPVSETPAVKSISDRQFFQQLAIDDVISEEEAEAAVATGTIPAEMLALIDALPQAQRFGARMMLKGATVFERHHPLTVTIGALYNWTDQQIDQLFQSAAAL